MVTENICSHPPQDGHWKFQEGRGSERTKFLRESMKLNWNFQRGGGREGQTENHPWGRYGYFIEPYNLVHILFTNQIVDYILNYVKLFTTGYVLLFFYFYEQ